MKTGEDRFRTGMFYNRHDANAAIKMLHELGYADDEISVMMSDDTRQRECAVVKGNKTTEGATAGGIIGGAIGAIAAVLTTSGALFTIVSTGGAAIPIIGPLAAILAGLGAGGLTGGVIGALVGAGIPEERAREIEKSISQGAIVIGVTPREPSRTQVIEILERPSRVTTEAGEIEASDFDDTSTIEPRQVR